MKKILLLVSIITVIIFIIGTANIIKMKKEVILTINNVKLVFTKDSAKEIDLKQFTTEIDTNIEVNEEASRILINNEEIKDKKTTLKNLTISEENKIEVKIKYSFIGKYYIIT